MAISLEWVDADAPYDAQWAQLRSDVDLLVRRLRSLTRHSWQPRRQAVLVLLETLAGLGATAENRRNIPVPPLPDHSLANAVAVIAGELLDSLANHPSAEVLSASEMAVRTAWLSTK